MCGRYQLKNTQALREAMAKIGAVTPYEFAQRFNVAPSQEMPVVVNRGSIEVAPMRWGFVPFWDKSEKPKLAPINARSEEALTKGMFKQSIQKRRCLIPADGFFEWRRISDNLKQPFSIGLRGARPFFVAGIYENKTDLRPDTYLLFTTGPNELMERIHNRMPVILTEEQAKGWIEPGEMSSERFAQFCRPYPSEDMEAVPVSSVVNNARFDAPECVAPLTEGA
jgi:putative SOS response-associated peptidase YedK